jgi:hypothetical protein
MNIYAIYTKNDRFASEILHKYAQIMNKYAKQGEIRVKYGSRLSNKVFAVRMVQTRLNRLYSAHNNSFLTTLAKQSLCRSPRFDCLESEKD